MKALRGFSRGMHTVGGGGEGVGRFRLPEPVPRRSRLRRVSGWLWFKTHPAQHQVPTTPESWRG